MLPHRNPIVQEDVQRLIARPLPWDALTGATVLVTGAAGFVPAYLVETLLHLNEARGSGIQVLALVRNRERALRRFAAHADRKDLRLVVQDAAEKPGIDGPVDYVIHAASQASPRYYGSDPVGTLLPNVLGTRHLLELARDRRSRALLFVSAGEAYGRLRDDQFPTRECDFGILDPTDLRSCYAEAKRMGETMCIAWHHQFGVPARIARPFHTYGPGLDPMDGRVFADFVAAIVAGRDLVLRSAGSARRAFCYLADVTEGLFTILLRGADGNAYNVGNPGGELSIRELAELLVGEFAERRLRVTYAARSSAGGYIESPFARNCPDVARMAALGWAPTTSVAEGFRRTVKALEWEG
jgi:UDP-glucuronate decarboxylase